MRKKRIRKFKRTWLKTSFIEFIEIEQECENRNTWVFDKKNGLLNQTYNGIIDA